MTSNRRKAAVVILSLLCLGSSLAFAQAAQAAPAQQAEDEGRARCTQHVGERPDLTAKTWTSHDGNLVSPSDEDIHMFGNPDGGARIITPANRAVAAVLLDGDSIPRAQAYRSGKSNETPVPGLSMQQPSGTTVDVCMIDRSAADPATFIEGVCDNRATGVVFGPNSGHEGILEPGTTYTTHGAVKANVRQVHGRETVVSISDSSQPLSYVVFYGFDGPIRVVEPGGARSVSAGFGEAWVYDVLVCGNIEEPYPNGPFGTIYRLYRAYFLREPERDGYQYWLGIYRDGRATLFQIADYFADSKEFKDAYGEVTGARYVRLVYKNVLEREPDRDGEAYWVDQMNRGMTRGEVMIYFSDSEEYRNKTADGRPPT